MTYNVFSGTLNPAQSVNQFRDITTYTVHVTVTLWGSSVSIWQLNNG